MPLFADINRGLVVWICEVSDPVPELCLGITQL